MGNDLLKDELLQALRRDDLQRYRRLSRVPITLAQTAKGAQIVPIKNVLVTSILHSTVLGG